MPTDVERQFEDQVMAVYENGQRVLGYNATRVLQKIRADGGLAAAKSWLRPKKKDKPTKGFLMLVDFGRLELSLEALVLNDPWNTLFNEDELATIKKLLDQIDEREAEILRLRFGLNRDEPMTLKDIGKCVGLTRERVRQIEKETLDKLNQILTAYD